MIYIVIKWWITIVSVAMWYIVWLHVAGIPVSDTILSNDII